MDVRFAKDIIIDQNKQKSFVKNMKLGCFLDRFRSFYPKLDKLEKSGFIDKKNTDKKLII